MRLQKDPLVHFLLLGALLFLVHAFMNRGGGASAEKTAAGPAPSEIPGAVAIGPEDVRFVREAWTAQWKREPTAAEMRSLLAAYIREQLLVREAREMGLDADDAVIRRRLIEKLWFVVEEMSPPGEPSDADLLHVVETHEVHVEPAAADLPNAPAPLTEEVRAHFLEMWRANRKRAHRDRFIGEVLKKYGVTLDPATRSDFGTIEDILAAPRIAEAEDGLK